MANEIGILVPLKYDWMEKTVELLQDGLEPSEIKQKLREYLSYEMESPDNIRKTCTELMNTWVTVKEDIQPIRNYALSIYAEENCTHALLHWCLLLLRYPVFSDMAGMIGKVLLFQDSFTAGWINKRIKEQWGDRNTFKKSIGVILRTMCELGALESIDTGVYGAKQRNIQSNNDLQMLMKTLLNPRMNAYYEVQDLSRVPQMFPFSYDIDYEWINAQTNFGFSSIGGKVILEETAKYGE